MVRKANFNFDKNEKIKAVFKIAPPTVNYELLINKPRINGIELEGNKTTADLKIQDDIDTTVEAHNQSEEAHTFIQDRITNEESARIAADEDLQRQIDEKGGDIAQERAERIAADTQLQLNINIEEQARISADNTEREERISAISSEETARIQADNQLQENINSEAQTRAQADTALQADITAEEQARIAEDNSLSGRINTEVSAREAADTLLDNKITAEEQARIAEDNSLSGRISEEATTREQQDIALGDRITGEAETREQQDIALGNAINTLENKVDAMKYGKSVEYTKAENTLALKDQDGNTLSTTIIEASGGGKAYASLSKIKDYLYNATYVNLDYNFAKEYFKTRKPQVNLGACSTVKKGNLVSRNFDWNFNTDASFVVRTPRNDGKFASISISSSVPRLTEEFMSSGDYDEESFTVLPFFVVDGINEYGVTASDLVVPAQKGITSGTVPQEEQREELCVLMLVRYILDNFKTAQEAVEYIRDYVSVYTMDVLQAMGYDLHFMVSDPVNAYALEFVNNAVVIKDITSKPYMTNFFLDGVTYAPEAVAGIPAGGVYTPATVSQGYLPSTLGITSHGSGLERYNLICSNYENLNSVADMKQFMCSSYSNSTLRYTQSYRVQTSPQWNTEFTGNWDWTDGTGHHVIELTADTPEADFTIVKDHVRPYYESGERDGKTWQTEHACVYDLEEKKLYLQVQEDLEWLEFTFNYYTRREVDEKFQPNLTSANAGTGISITGSGKDVVISSTATGGTWGTITGDIEDQEDLQTALNSKWQAGSGVGSLVTKGNADNGGQADGDYSVAEGFGSDAKGNYSHVEGQLTTANGGCAHAEGQGTTAQGNCAHAEGMDTIAQNQVEHAEGQYNKSHKASTMFGNAGNTIHSVGIGTGAGSLEEQDRRNAIEIMQNGDIYIKGVGNYDGQNYSGSSTIQTTVNGKVNTSDIINNLTTTDTNKPLSANMGKDLNDRLQNVESRGRFLSTWNCKTGLAGTEPTTNPYDYRRGDYFIVSVIDTTTNYRPSGTQYDKTVPSTTLETEVVKPNDTYIYDGTKWILQANVDRDVAFSTIAGSPYDNTELSTALNAKVTGNNAITGGTKCKITYDSKGLVTSGSDLDASDIPNIQLSKISDVTASASELNVLDGITASTTELNYVDGVTSNIQTQLSGKQPNLTSDNAGTGISITGSGSTLKINNTQTSAEWGNITGDITDQDDLQTALSNACKITGITAGGTNVTITNKVAAIPNATNSVAGVVKVDNTTIQANSGVIKAKSLDGLTASITELNYTDGVTSNIQTQLNSKLTDVKVNGTSVVTGTVANVAVPKIILEDID